jgi:hypothetical protein
VKILDCGIDLSGTCLTTEVEMADGRRFTQLTPMVTDAEKAAMDAYLKSL